MTENEEKIVEAMAESAHDAWWETYRQLGYTSRLAAWGEEFMVPFDKLSERGKEFDRIIMRAILKALDRLLLAEYLWGLGWAEGDPLIYGLPGKSDRPLWLVADKWSMVMMQRVPDKNEESQKVWAESPRLGENAAAWRKA